MYQKQSTRNDIVRKATGNKDEDVNDIARRYFEMYLAGI